MAWNALTQGLRGGPLRCDLDPRSQKEEATVNSLFEIQRLEPEAFVSEGDCVVVLGNETTRVNATGKVLELRWAHAFTVRNGKVATFEEYQDVSVLVAELRHAQYRT